MGQFTDSMNRQRRLNNLKQMGKEVNILLDNKCDMGDMDFFITVAIGAETLTLGTSWEDLQAHSKLGKGQNVQSLMSAFRSFYEKKDWEHATTALMVYITMTDTYKICKSTNQNHIFMSFFINGMNHQTRIHAASKANSIEQAKLNETIVLEFHRQGPKYPWR